MNLDFKNFYKNINNIVKDDIIDLSRIEFVHPWSIVMICLLLIERKDKPDKKLLLPKKAETNTYLKRMHFDKILSGIGYDEAKEVLDKVRVPERDNKNIHEILHCYYRDEFNARLGRFIAIFRNFGLSESDAQRATALVGELGNNVFDHNLGNWPTNVSGCIIAAQHYPSTHIIEIAVGDPGVGFYGSLKTAFPDITNDIEAIKLGLTGHTGRVGEVRGNGLKLIQQWTIKNLPVEL
jgi:anti-sigma regulatory factor (Ser/Thr protein kinase)